MLVSTRGRYALRIMMELAKYDRNRYIPLPLIAENQEVSEKYLESIISVLAKAGLVEGLRGKGGGYRLCVGPDQLTVGAVLRLTEGSLAPVACLEKGASPCERAAECRTLPLWSGLNDVINEYLDRFTISDLVRSADSGFDYVI